MLGRRKKEGKPISDKPENKLWQQWFEKLSINDHDEKLRQLGLDDEDVEEFNTKFTDGKKSASDKTDELEETADLPEEEEPKLRHKKEKK